MVLNKRHRRVRMTHPIMRKGHYHELKPKEQRELRKYLRQEYGTDDLEKLRERHRHEEYD